MLTIPEAIQAFGKGFSFTRSFTHPYEFAPLGPLWVLRDAPAKKQDPRNQEILIHGLKPADAVALVRQYDAPKYALCVIEGMAADFEGLKKEYKSLGYRLWHTEPLFVKSLAAHELAETDSRVRRVTDADLANQVAKAARSRQILPPHLEQNDSELRLYVALDQREPVGWVKSVAAGEGARWVSNLYVKESHRRQGLGRALMNAMLNEDRTLGYRDSVLLASSAGSRLYPTLGYEQIGLLLLLTPKKGG